MERDLNLDFIFIFFFLLKKSLFLVNYICVLQFLYFLITSAACIRIEIAFQIPSLPTIFHRTDTHSFRHLNNIINSYPPKSPQITLYLTSIMPSKTPQSPPSKHATPTKTKNELRTALTTLFLCALSYAIFVFVIFSIKEIAVRSLGAGTLMRGVGGGGDVAGDNLGAVVGVRRMFVNKGH